MYRILSRRVVVTILVGAGAGGMAVLMTLWDWATGQNLGLLNIPRAIAGITFVVGTVVIPVAGLVWRSIWRRIPRLNRWVFPDLNGVWEGSLRSTWINTETGQPVPTIPVRVTITQGIVNMSVRMGTDNMNSFSTWIELKRLDSGIFRICYNYDHMPTPESQPDNPPHNGIAYLMVDADTPNRLEGYYFTYRQTTGSFTLTRSDP